MSYEHYFIVCISRDGCESTRHVFLREENARACLAHWVAIFEKSNDGTVTRERDGVRWELSFSAGTLSMSAKLFRLGTDDHLFPVRPNP
jgi:hypothetical protein